MLRYDQLSIGTGGPWFGPLPVPGLSAGKMLQKREIVSKIKHNGTNESIALTGGEPLLHPEISEIIGEAKRAGYRRVMVRTDSKKLDDFDFLTHILKAGVSSFEVMLPGDLDARSAHTIFEQYRGLRNIRRISEWEPIYANIYLGVVVPVGRGNYQYMSEVLNRVLSALAVDRVLFSWGEPDFPIWQASASIERAMDVCKKKWVWPSTRGIPACVIPARAHHFEELFHANDHTCVLSLPAQCKDCCFHAFCARLPAVEFMEYAWEVRPILEHRYFPFIKDILEKGHLFDEANADLYS